MGLLLCGCNSAPPTPTAPAPVAQVVTGAGTVGASVLDDIAAALEADAASLCAALEVACPSGVTVEVFPDQASFDEHVMNPNMRGYYAISGERRIQMVSPASPAPHDIGYEDGVGIAVHEFIHLILDEIEPELPAWLDEGTAVHLGPHAAYADACQGYFPFERLPSFGELRDAYAEVPAADLYAYTAVDFIANQYGMETLNALLRAPDSLESVLGVSAAGFETRWWDYTRQHCSTGAPRFEPQACWFEAPAGANVTCGYVEVAEDRLLAISPENTVRLAVAIFHSTAPAPAPDPIVYQAGGPGGHMLVIAPELYEKVITPFLGRRDLILFDPRGTGFSQPALECRADEAPGDCLRRLGAEGHNLYAYSSASMAADLQDLRQALGYDQWNLLGESYGTHVAQVTMRVAPDGLRSVILDSVMPVVIPPLPNGRGPTEVAFHRLMEQCAQDPACNAANPSLDYALERGIRRLNTEPVTLEVDCYGELRTVVLTGDRLSAMVSNVLYETELIPGLPQAITAAADGRDYSFWQAAVRWEYVIDLVLSKGAHWSVQCSDGRLGDACEDWPIVVEQAPVVSDIPTLVISGEFDPVTPLEYGHSVAQRLPNSFVYDFPGFGHWVNGTGQPCQINLIQAFLDDPWHEPNASCLTDIVWQATP